MPKLKRFNQAIVDHYTPESSGLTYAFGDNFKGVRTFIHYYKQKKDLFKALQHAEDKLLKFFENPQFRARLTGSSIINMLKQIHKFAGKTICSDSLVKSGEYIDSIVARWEKTTDFQEELREAINTPREQNPGKKVDTVFAKYNLTECAHTWKMAACILASNNIELPPAYQLGDDLFTRTLCLIAYQRKKGVLKEYEKDIDKVVKFVYPEDLNQQMKDFTDKLATDIQQCDGTLDNVVALAVRAFRDFAFIHPFPNANGRVSTILLNLILVGFGHPSIVVRNQEDRHNDNSEYNRAMNIIDTDIRPFEAYIKKKVLQEKASPDKGTLESWPANDGSGEIFIEELFKITKKYKHALKNAEDGQKFNDARNNRHLREPTEALNQELKLECMPASLRFSNPPMPFTLPYLFDYTFAEMELAHHMGTAARHEQAKKEADSNKPACAITDDVKKLTLK